MKIPILIFLTILSTFNFSKKRVDDFDSELSEITEKFTDNIMDKYECENQIHQVEDLSEEIQKGIESENEFTAEEKNTLKKLKKEAYAVERFIGTIGDCSGTYWIKTSDLELASERIEFNMYSVNNKFCSEIIKIEIKNFVSFLAKNNSDVNYSLSYNWKTPSGLTKADGKMGMSKKTIRSIYNNREKPNQKNILFSNMNCTEF